MMCLLRPTHFRLAELLVLASLGVLGCGSNQAVEPPSKPPAADSDGVNSEEMGGGEEKSPPAATAVKPRSNQLANETSPYLLQHAQNPVDWYPWGEEALGKARRENKPIFLSIGYSSCHWCHVMERESFMDAEIAQFMNDNFVCIKVDREERPDVDEIYMTAVQIITRRGGWPLSVFLTPEAKPFFGGTYFPPRDGDRAGATGFLTVLRSVDEAWRKKNDDARRSADELTKLIAIQMATPPRPTDEIRLDGDLPTRTQETLARQFDPTFGGFGYNSVDPRQPKFPQAPTLFFLVDRVQRTNDEDARNMLIVTLDHMAMGGLRDHVAGGFHRYSVDRYWHIPHFEKMLYDNGQLASVYAEAYALTKDTEYRRIVDRLVEFIAREMTSPDGAFYAALDADSEHEEGKFYRWRLEEWTEILGASDAETFAQVYAEQQQPNFEERFHVPLLQTHWSELAEREPFASKGLETVLGPWRDKLLAARGKRVRPMTDTKVITSWNGMMIRGLADAGRLLDRPKYVERASTAARFVFENLRDTDGRLQRTYSAGKAKLNAYVDDYALLIDGLLALHRATNDRAWLDSADALMQKQIEFFWDDEGGGFFYTSADHESLIARGKQFRGSARPAGNSVSANNLLYLAVACDNNDYRTLAEKTIRAALPLLDRVPAGTPRMSVAVARLLDSGGESTGAD